MLPPLMFVMAAASALVAGVIAVLWRQEREPYLALWGAAHALQAGRYAVGAVAQVLQVEEPMLPLILLGVLAGGLVHLAGTYRFVGRRMGPHWMVAGALALGWLVVSPLLDAGFMASTLPFFFFTGLVDLATGIALLRAPVRSAGRILAGGSFFLWGLHRMDFPFLRPVAWFAPWGFALAIVFAVGVAVGLVLLHLDRSRARHRDSFDHAIVGMYRATADGRFEAVNATLVRMLGYDSVEEVLALSMPDVLGFDEDDVVDGVEVRWPRRDGRLLVVEVFGRRIRDAEGNLVAFEGSVRDVTEGRALRERLAQGQKMEAVGQLAGGVAHDFNNLLTAILAGSELAAGHLPADHPARSELHGIREAAERGAALTQQLLAFSSRQLVAPRHVDLVALLARTERMLGRLLPEDIERELMVGDSPLWVVADPVQIDQIVINLAVNARDAMPSGGRLTIWLGRDGDEVGIEVSDVGQGIPADQLPHIFEPFYTTKGVGKGTGLGLATVYGVVQQLGGRVDVDSRPGRTTFRVRLPAAAAPPATQTEERPAPSGVDTARPRRVLVIEDEEEIRRILVRALEQAGYVVEAPPIAQVDEVLERHRDRFDLLVSDVVLPGARGPELARRFRQGRPSAPVLFVSGYPRDQASDALDGPATRFLAKPFRAAAFLHEVRLLLSGA